MLAADEVLPHSADERGTSELAQNQNRDGEPVGQALNHAWVIAQPEQLGQREIEPAIPRQRHKRTFRFVKGMRELMQRLHSDAKESRCVRAAVNAVGGVGPIHEVGAGFERDVNLIGAGRQDEGFVSVVRIRAELDCGHCAQVVTRAAKDERRRAFEKLAGISE